MRKVPKDEGQEGRRLVARVYVEVIRLSSPSSVNAAQACADGWTPREFNTPDLVIRSTAVDAIVKRWPEIDRMYAAKVIRDLCRGTCAVSDGWRVRLEALAACGQPMDNSGGAE